MKDFIQRYKNAKVAIRMIRNGEFVPHFNDISNEHLAAYKGDLRLWLGNGGFFCEIEKTGIQCLGLFWRHWVYWAAARKLKIDADKKVKYKPAPILEES